MSLSRTFALIGLVAANVLCACGDKKSGEKAKNTSKAGKTVDLSQMAADTIPENPRAGMFDIEGITGVGSAGEYMYIRTASKEYFWYKQDNSGHCATGNAIAYYKDNMLTIAKKGENMTYIGWDPTGNTLATDGKTEESECIFLEKMDKKPSGVEFTRYKHPNEKVLKPNRVNPPALAD